MPPSIPCLLGKVNAICQLLSSSKQINEFKNSNILLARYIDPNWLLVIKKSFGVITAIGGLLCHTAIICRELDIPYVVGVGMDYLEKINRQKITLDGQTGEVTIDK